MTGPIKEQQEFVYSDRLDVKCGNVSIEVHLLTETSKALSNVVIQIIKIGFWIVNGQNVDSVVSGYCFTVM